MAEPGSRVARLILCTQSAHDAAAALPLLGAFLDWRRSDLVGQFSGESGTQHAIGSRQKVVTFAGRQLPLVYPRAAGHPQSRSSRRCG